MMLNGYGQRLSASLEDYLEAIFHLEKEHRVARSKDIAHNLKVARSSVTGALKTLADKKLINYSPYSHVTLTGSGQRAAKEVIRRHETLKNFFQHVLLLSGEHAEDTACRMEHALDAKAADRLYSFMDFLKKCPRTGENWLDSFAHWLEGTPELSLPKCSKCLQELLGRTQEDA